MEVFLPWHLQPPVWACVGRAVVRAHQSWRHPEELSGDQPLLKQDATARLDLSLAGSGFVDAGPCVFLAHGPALPVIDHAFILSGDAP